MSDSIQNPMLLQQSAEWVALLTSGRATDADAEALLRWRNQSPDHARAFHDAVVIRDSLIRAGRDGQIGNEIQVANRISLNRRLVLGGGFATAVAVAGFVDPPLDLWPSLSDLTADYHTAKGEMRQIAWARGISVELNTYTSLSRRGDGDALKLIDGEVAVKAVLTGQRQFVLNAGRGAILAHNAEFNVRDIGAANICITCASGSVRVQAPGANAVLSANQQFTYSDQSVGKIVTVNPEVFTAWRAGQIVLRDTTLEAAVAEINRYRPGLIVVAGDALRRQRISTTLYLAQLDRVIPLICTVTGAHAATVGGYTLLT